MKNEERDEHYVPIENHELANYAPGAGLRTVDKHTFEVPLPNGKTRLRTITFEFPTTIVSGHHLQYAIGPDPNAAHWTCAKCNMTVGFVLDENVCPHACVVDGQVVLPEHAASYIDVCTVPDHTIPE